MIAEPSAKDPSAEESEAMETETEISSADEAEAMEIDETPPSRDWRSQYLEWMNRGVLPSDRAQAWRITRRAKSFVLIDDKLYKRSPSGVLQHCIPIPKGKKLIRDIHANLWSPRGATHPHRQCVQAGLLLANCSCRCHRSRADL